MPVDSIPTDLNCQCNGGAIYNVVREYPDLDHVTYEIMRWKYHSAADVLRKGIHVRIELLISKAIECNTKDINFTEVIKK